MNILEEVVSSQLRTDLPAIAPADTARARELYETMARELAFDPRAHGRS